MPPILIITLKNPLSAATPRGFKSQKKITLAYVSSGQGSSGYWPSSVEYSRFPSVLAGQTHEGPSYQTWNSPSK